MALNSPRPGHHASARSGSDKGRSLRGPSCPGGRRALRRCARRTCARSCPTRRQSGRHLQPPLPGRSLYPISQEFAAEDLIAPAQGRGQDLAAEADAKHWDFPLRCSRDQVMLPVNERDVLIGAMGAAGYEDSVISIQAVRKLSMNAQQRLMVRPKPSNDRPALPRIRSSGRCQDRADDRPA